jgi:ribosomal protein L39E
MARYKHTSKKKRLIRAGKQSRWAPFWAVARKYGMSRRMHPARITHIKRSWRRTRIRA